ncbi:hypothetical protein R6Z07F_008833 [Ovis aries]
MRRCRGRHQLREPCPSKVPPPPSAEAGAGSPPNTAGHRFHPPHTLWLSQQQAPTHTTLCLFILEFKIQRRNEFNWLEFNSPNAKNTCRQNPEPKFKSRHPALKPHTHIYEKRLRQVCGGRQKPRKQEEVQLSRGIMKTGPGQSAHRAGQLPPEGSAEVPGPLTCRCPCRTPVSQDLTEASPFSEKGRAESAEGQRAERTPKPEIELRGAGYQVIT